MVFLRSCLNEARSDGVSILDTNEIPCLALREAVEAVAEDALPPFFDLFAMFRSKGSQRAGLQRECGGIRSAGQRSPTEDSGTAMNEISAQVGERAALSYEIIYHEVVAAGRYGTFEYCRPDHPLPPGCASVIDDIGLNDPDLDL